MTSTPLIVSVAGSTSHTVQCAEALLADGRFQISWILTPPPKPIGRKQIITKNALHLFAEAHQLPVIFVEKKVNLEIKAQIEAQPQPDLLLVVDFGYLIPEWLLQWPKISPLNVHPSALPKWRGSSPGQFVLLYGEKKSAVTLMVMDKGMDTGPLIWQEPFTVEPEWTQTEYYQSSFELIGKMLAEKVAQFADGSLSAKAQPEVSPTLVARRLSKEDGFVSWEVIESALKDVAPASTAEGTSPLLQEVFNSVHSWPQVIAQAIRGLSPWPGVWTVIQTAKGEKRMNIVQASFGSASGRLDLEKVKIEGQDVAAWNQVKNQVLASS